MSVRSPPSFSPAAAQLPSRPSGSSSSQSTSASTLVACLLPATTTRKSSKPKFREIYLIQIQVKKSHSDRLRLTDGNNECSTKKKAFQKGTWTTLSTAEDLGTCDNKEFDITSLKVRVHAEVFFTAIQVSFDGNYLPSMEANPTELIGYEWIQVVEMRVAHNR